MQTKTEYLVKQYLRPKIGENSTSNKIKNWVKKSGRKHAFWNDQKRINQVALESEKEWIFSNLEGEFPPIPALAVDWFPSYCQEQVTQENAMAKS